MSFADDFLADVDPRTWSSDSAAGGDLQPRLYYLGRGDHALEVAVAEASARPHADAVRALWHARQKRRPSPLLLVIGYPYHGLNRVTVCGPVGDNPPLLPDLEVSQVERLCAAALSEPSRHAAIRFLVGMLPEVGADLPGVRNSGLLATQELQYGVPARPDWPGACRASRALLGSSGQRLVERLGFTVEPLSTSASVLATRSAKRAVAVFLDEGEAFEDPAARFGTSPVSHALALADQENLPWVVVTRGRQIRLYAARADTGVGRKGRASTFVELNLALLPEDRAGYLSLLFSGDALGQGGSIEDILDRSADFAAALGSRLRDRVYFEAVPALSRAIAGRLGGGDVSDSALEHAYEQTLMILFRLLFVAYGEDKDLLPYRTNGRYNDHSLKRLARRLAEWQTRSESFDWHATDLWDDVRALWEAVSNGNSGWGVPAYDGGLFSSDQAVSRAGADLTRLALTDAEFGPALTALLVDSGTDEVIGPVDFRSLSVREFGTLYEGLLESRLSLAPVDLTVDQDKNYVPASRGAPVIVPAGTVYFHDRSGSRKSSGSYFTKPFAVEHLLDYALEPALDGHLARLATLLDSGDEPAAARAFFDFRCADLAMGSGHFLVAAVDRIEARLSGFLSLRPIPGVLSELDELRRAALTALGDLADGVEIETATLLRRQVARRCIYGVDRTSMAVELARLAMWIHTFVPGLPLSFLSHGLVAGDSLTGIGSLKEALTILEPDHDPAIPSLLSDQIEAFLARAEAALRRLAAAVEKTTRDIETSRTLQAEALEAVRPAEQLFDILVAARLGQARIPLEVDEESITGNQARKKAADLTADLHALHFPIVFPEVFLRGNPGFDCILGNPPWDKVLFEAQAFWVARAPGLNALPDAQRKRAIIQLRAQRPDEARAEETERSARERLQVLIEAAYPSRGRGHYDFAKLFTERALGLLRGGATLGYVLPASSLVLGGWGKLRDLLLRESDIKVAQARNKGGWLFDDVHHSYAVALIARQPKAAADSEVTIWPGITSVNALRAIAPLHGLQLARSVLDTLSDSSVIPWLNHPGDQPIFEAMRSRPSLASGRGWITGTHDARWDFRGSGPHNTHAAPAARPGAWQVLMARHVTQFTIDVGPAFQQAVAEPAALGHGIVRGPGGAAVLGEDHPLIVMRHPSRNDDSRTMIATALPEQGFLHNKGYVHAIRHEPGTTTRQLLALLGFLNSFTCDWWVRRFVDRHVTAPVVNNIRLPDWDDAQITRAADTTALVLAGQAGPGAGRLAGGRVIQPAMESRDRIGLLADLESLSARGFGFGPDLMVLILDDFSERRGCPPELRTAILERLA